MITMISKPLGPSPRASSKAVSNVMKANVAKNTSPEIVMRKALRRHGLVGYKTCEKNIPGKPDISFVKIKIAIFVHGCFWHGCPKHGHSLPKTHTEFWKRKFERNRERDRRKKRELERLGWKVFEFWEHDVRSNPDKLAKRVLDYARFVEKAEGIREGGARRR